MLTATRTGGSLVFKDHAGRVVGTILIVDLGSLVAAGDTVPILYDDGRVGEAGRSRQTCMVRLNNCMTYTCPWHTFRRCALLIGTSIEFTTQQQGGPQDHRCPGPVKDHVVSGSKMGRPRPTPRPVFTQQMHRRPMPAGGVA